MPLRLPQEPIQPFNVIAFDPGGTTGWAWASLAKETLAKRATYVEDKVQLEDIYIETGELGPKEHHRDLWEFVRAASTRMETPLEIVFEPFHFRQHVDNPRHKVELISCEYIGIIKLACAQLGLTYYDRFTPGEAKRFVTNKKLELLRWLQEPQHRMRHRNDALRQLVKYLIVRRGIQHPITTAWRVDATGSA